MQLRTAYNGQDLPRKYLIPLILAFVIGGVWLVLPPKTMRLPTLSDTSLTPVRQRSDTAATSVVAGAFHVHTNRSDGSGSIDDIARAAARAGLQFVILTDHGNGTRAPEPSAYRSGVLMVDGDIGDKKLYDPRSYLKAAEKGVADRLGRACDDLLSTGRTLFGKV